MLMKRLCNVAGIFIFLLAFLPKLYAQELEITGKVTNEVGSPLAGATIRIKGTQTATTTNEEGDFRIKVPSVGSTLIISFIGMAEQEVVVSGPGPLRVAMLLGEAQMTDVVVVGYGAQRKSDVTGSVSKVEMEKALAIPTTNVSEMLRGQATGVQVTLGSARPGGTSDILIRGRNSIRGGNQPLIVLDGFPIENINDINPDDIASMEVLKDASAQAIYGARASNGVILVTTKKGKTGKLKVGIHSYLTTQKLTKNFDLYSAEEFAQYRREARRTILPGQVYDPVDANNFGGPTAAEWLNYSAGNWADWENEVLRTGMISSNTVSINGGSETTKIFSSVTYFTQSGVIPSSSYKRASFRLNLDQKLSKNASMEANINFATDKQDRETSNLDFITISPFTGPYDLEGNLVRNVAGANASSSTINPLWNIRESTNDVKTNFLNINLVGNYKFTKNFSYKLNTLLSRRFGDEGTYITRLHSAGVTPSGSATLTNSIREEYLVENILNYIGKINENNRFDVTLVQSVNERNSSRTFNTGTGFGNDILGYDGITNALNFTTTRNEERYRLVSFLGRVRYNLMDKYSLQLTGRQDGASVFGANRKWGFFPAASAAWQIHREGFLSGSKTITNLKYRVSYGSVGNQSLDPFTTLGVVGAFPYIFGGAITTGNLPGSVLPNPNLTWETSTTFNTGFDFGFLRNRITGTIDYYSTRTTNLLTDISIGGSTGFSSTITNGGESKNSGIEVLLTGDIVRTKSFNWSVTAGFTRNRNELVKTGLFNDDGSVKSDLGRNRFGGSPINVIYTKVFDGIFQTDADALGSAQGSKGGTVTPFQPLNTLHAGAIRLKDVNGDGIINDLDDVIIKTDPDWFGSLSTNLSYKGFELLADFYMVEGAIKRNPYLADFNQGGYNTSVRNGLKRDYWTPENPSNSYPRPNFNQVAANIGSLAVADASYLRLRTLSLAYNLQASVLDRMKLSNVRFYITATNLFTITDYKSYSPENNPGDFPDTKGFTGGIVIGL
jgi:TonB-dependent starch-binding outer membrane protein SusC